MINQQLITFISVAKSGSFSKTAEAMFISPTAVMKQIDALENRLEITLFKRTNHGLQLTDAGQSVLSDAKYLVEYSTRAIEKAREIERKENQRSIRIGTSLMTPAKFILDIWTEIQDIAPNLKVELIPFENTPENAREILSNLGMQIDVVAGIYDEDFKEERGFQTILLEEKKVSFAVPLTSPLAFKRSISPEDLKQTGAMFIKKGWNKYIDKLRASCENAGVKIIDFNFFNLAAFNEAVKQNVPIIAISDWENVHPLLKIVPSKTSVTVPYGIMYSLEPSKHVLQFIKAVKHIVNKQN
mgnify:CR=1 FL=1